MTQLFHAAAHVSCSEEHPDQVGFAHLPVELFRIGDSHWALDANRVEFVRVDQVASDVIRCLRQEELAVDQLASRLPQHPRGQVEEAFDEVLSAQQQGLFLPAHFQRRLRFPSDYWRSMLQDRMAGLTLSLTTACNLSCSYCIFGGRYSRYPAQPGRTMTWPTVQNALDFLLAHSQKSKSLHVLFFGGEPLIAFNLIKRAVAHLQAALIDDPRKLRLSICTNGTILSEAILSFLVANKITVQFSLDGDPEMHDQNRRFKTSGKGSFDTIVKNLKAIEQFNPEYFRQFVQIKGVIACADGCESTRVFQESPVRELVAAQHVSYVLLEPHYDISLDTDYFQQLHQLGEMLLRKKGVETLEELLQDFSPNQKRYFWQSYGWFFAAQGIERLGQRGEQQLPFSKGCMLGASEAHVGPDGNISICHKAQHGQAFVIGNVNTGIWDIAAIDRLSEWLHRFDGCSSCFAQRFCDLCFEKLDGEWELLDASRTRYCQFMRHSLRVIFQNMLGVMDNNPRLWEEVVRYINQRVAKERIEQQERLQAS